MPNLFPSPDSRQPPDAQRRTDADTPPRSHSAHPLFSGAHGAGLTRAHSHTPTTATTAAVAPSQIQNQSRWSRHPMQTGGLEPSMGQQCAVLHGCMEERCLHRYGFPACRAHLPSHSAHGPLFQQYGNGCRANRVVSVCAGLQVVSPTAGPAIAQPTQLPRACSSDPVR